MREIDVEALGHGRYQVRVREGSSSTDHVVTVPQGFVSKIGLGRTDEATVVEQTFAFLLEREPPAAILADFHLGVVSRYFPEFETELKRRLAM
ncbi:MAG TPA: hypothetical protein VMD28_10135 [Acidimicrobiales bacterium]|nr:hypothetical protein [Acidimicrobiales bacterium]